MIFVDDFTCFTWLFFLKRKSGVFSVFLHSKSLVGNQFNNKIKALSSDGGGEFLNHKIKAFCLNNGISHNLSYPTPLNKMGWLKENIDKLLRPVWLCFIRLIFHCLIGLMLSVLLSIFHCFPFLKPSLLINLILSPDCVFFGLSTSFQRLYLFGGLH